jgi:hypothetical protein
MTVVKFKPLRTARLLDASTQKVQENSVQAVQRSQSAVGRSKELVSKSKKVIAAITKRSAG